MSFILHELCLVPSVFSCTVSSKSILGGLVHTVPIQGQAAVPVPLIPAPPAQSRARRHTPKDKQAGWKPDSKLMVLASLRSLHKLPAQLDRRLLSCLFNNSSERRILGSPFSVVYQMRLQHSGVCLRTHAMLLAAVSEPRWSQEWMEGLAEETFIPQLFMMLKQAACKKGSCFPSAMPISSWHEASGILCSVLSRVNLLQRELGLCSTSPLSLGLRTSK